MCRALSIRLIIIVVIINAVFNTKVLLAGGVTIPVNWSVNVNDFIFNIDGNLNNHGILQVETGTINLNGDWNNLNIFSAGSGVVNLNSDKNGQSVRRGSSSSRFNTLTVTNTDVSGITFSDGLFCNTLNALSGVQKLSFGTSGVHIVLDTFNVNGTPGNLIMLAPQIVSNNWDFNAPATTVKFLNVNHSQQIDGATIMAESSVDGGNNRNWRFIATPSPTLAPVLTPVLTPSLGPVTTPLITPPLFGPGPTDTPNAEATPSPEATPNSQTDDQPIAAFSAVPETGIAPLEVVFTDESTNSPGIWLWEFGDGGVGNTQNPIHAYHDAGFYSVTLIVANQNGTDTIRKEDLITVSENELVADFIIEPVIGGVPLKVQFTDDSVPKDSVVSWLWEFGDGANAVEQNPLHEYIVEGFYTVKLTVSNSPIASAIREKAGVVFVQPANFPIAGFNFEQNDQDMPGVVEFIDLSEPGGNIDSWLWDFGDGTFSTEQNPEHVYEAGSVYTVKLSVKNDNGADTEVKRNLIGVVTDDVPIAAFTASSLDGIVPFKVNFTDNSVGKDIVSWLWEFGDGSKNSNQNTTHIYKNIGIFSAKLTVTNSFGSDAVDEVGHALLHDDMFGDFSANPILGVVPFEVQFIDYSIGNVGVWDWDFGDGGKGSGRFPLHTYTEAGVYTVGLTVGDGDSLSLTNKFDFITALEASVVILSEGTQTVTELLVIPKAISRSKSPNNITVAVIDQKGNLMEGVRIDAVTSGRKAIVSPEFAISNSDGFANFDVTFSTIRRVSSVIFSAEGVSVVIEQN